MNFANLTVRRLARALAPEEQSTLAQLLRKVEKGGEGMGKKVANRPPGLGRDVHLAPTPKSGSVAKPLRVAELSGRGTPCSWSHGTGGSTYTSEFGGVANSPWLSPNEAAYAKQEWLWRPVGEHYPNMHIDNCAALVDSHSLAKRFLEICNFADAECNPKAIATVISKGISYAKTPQEAMAMAGQCRRQINFYNCDNGKGGWMADGYQNAIRKLNELIEQATEKCRILGAKG